MDLFFTMQGSFSEESLEVFNKLASATQGLDYSESEADSYDFTRCIRPNGTAYGTGGTCRKGSPAEKTTEEGVPKGWKPSPLGKDPERALKEKIVWERNKREVEAITQGSAKFDSDLEKSSNEEKKRKLKSEIERIEKIPFRLRTSLLERVGDLGVKLRDLSETNEEREARIKRAKSMEPKRRPAEQMRGFKEAQVLLDKIPSLTRKIRSNTVNKKHPEIVRELTDLLEQAKQLLAE